MFIFPEATFIGHAAAKAAFDKTFNSIENEVFSPHDCLGTVDTDARALLLNTTAYREQFARRVDLGTRYREK